MLIVIEGIDGSGKTTQSKILVRKLRSLHLKVATLKFPQYNFFFGRIIKKFLKGKFEKETKLINPYFTSSFYALDRLQGKAKLQHLLEESQIVVLQRYVTSNLIYQPIHLPSQERGALCKWIERMEYDIFGFPKPDMVIYLYLPTRLAYALILKRGGKRELYENNCTYLKKVNHLALSLAEHRKKWYVVQCNKGKKILAPNIIAQKVWDLVSSHNKKISIS